MKHLLLIIPLLFFSSGCEEDDTLEEVTNTVIDENLIGVWKYNYSNESDDYYYYHDYIILTFSSNGNFSRTFHNYSGYPFDLSPVYVGTDDVTGDFWVEDNILIMSGDEENFIYDYSINGNLLSISESLGVPVRIYTKQ